jgi:beta-glucosidase
MNKPSIPSIIVIALSFLFAIGCTKQPLPYLNPQLSVEERADDLLKRLTLEEKVSLMRYESPAIERLGIPEYNWWNECLHGVGRAGIATVFPQAIGMAAMWDDHQMFRIATAISDEARAKHHLFAAEGKRGIYQGLTFWTPNINIFRDPRWGRGMETYGEDPYLTGQLGINFIKGLQGNDPNYFKLIATAKHFVVHSGPEWNRHSFNAKPSKQDFYETYTPHFKRVIQESGVYSVMCAYNRLNDLPCCGSTFVDSLLRVQWGFKGYIVSDCWAIHDFYDKGAHETVPTVEQAAAMAVKAGTDLNCGESYAALTESVKQGLITEEELNVSVKRLLLAFFKLGIFDDQQKVMWSKIPPSVIDSKEHQELALETARKSMVLLKNTNNVLPLSKELSKVAVIGPNAHNIDVLLGNYNGYPSNPKTPFDGIREKLPNAEVVYAQGSRLANEMPYMKPIPADVLFTDESLTINGLNAAYYNNGTFEGTPAHTVTDKNVDFIWWDKAPFADMNPSEFTVRWTGYLVPAQTGEHALGATGQYEYKVYLDNNLIAEHKSVHHPVLNYETAHLTAGKKYKITVEYKQQKTEYATVQLLWDTPNQNLLQEAIDVAKKSDVIVLCLGLSPLLEGEEMKVKVPGFKGGDRETIDLPAAQTQLAKALFALKKPIVLVLLNGSAISINWEAQNIPAIVEAWYPGQAGGTAIADVLFGDYNPSGRLPVTFYKNVHQLPDFEDYTMQGRTYRYFKDEPIWPFGHGLSYSTYEYSNLVITNEIEAGQELSLSVDVKNTSKLNGEEVVQLYISHPKASGQVPIRSLQAFKRIKLNAGESKTITFTLSPSQIATFNEQGQAWVNEGDLNIAIGGSQPAEAQRANDGKALTANISIKGNHHIVD